jgi:hypothetical protein
MTPAEWQPAEGVVVVDVAARRLRGHPKGLLHGKGADSRCSVESSSGATRHGFVQGNGMWNGDGDIGEVFGRQRRLRTPGYPALLGRWGAGTGAGAMAILWTAAMFLESDLDGGRMGLGWPVGSPITTSRGCPLGPMRDRVKSLLESAGSAVSLGARNSLRVCFTQQAAAIVRQQWWQ